VPNTSVLASSPIPDNCHTIIFLNRSGNLVLIGNGAAGGALVDNGVDSTPLLANAELTWAVGILSERVSSLDDLIYDAIGGAANVDITYLCSNGAG
jgi:hypothetical protein